MTTMELKSRIKAYKEQQYFARQMANECNKNNNSYDETIWDAIAVSFELLVEKLENALKHRA